MNGKKPVIQFNDFNFHYKIQNKPTLHDINLTIYEGEKVLILGASGSGKSTLANCINGLIPFSFEGNITGSLKVNDQETRDMSIYKLSTMVGTVLQDSDAQFVGLSVGEDIAFAMENDNIPRAEMLPKVLQYSTEVGMEDYLLSLPFNLSGGQKQKVALAGVLGDSMNILIFDEPLASLDPYSGTVTIDLIDQIARNGNRTVVIIEHRLEDALYRPVDRVILMDKGRIVADTTADALLRGDLLREYGIREPLYISALKYAGCDINTIQGLDDPSTLELSDENKKKLRAFFESQADIQPPVLGEETINVDNVTFSYIKGTKAKNVLKDVSFSVKKGERIALIGKNGAGKTTLARLICGIDRPNAGIIYINGENNKALSVREIGEEIGYVMQNPNQMIVKDIIKDEVELALRLKKLPDDEVINRAENTLKTCELYRMRNWPVDAVSYGQKKRVTVASILALEPEVIILDEPTAGQDYRHYMEIINFINKLNAEFGKTIIFITHDMHLAIENTDRAVVLSESELIADESVFSVLSDDDVITRANLKQTSLYILAKKIGISPEKCIEHYILYERMVRVDE
ncbi:MAG: ABC transporter ATP-binding protein [Oscillospiraceae bacterium]|jgi:energy-coupling factor transport system ATP-binding protein|nr:ABC transporter ATP-binding protein [Oscillospiraceae bacterium]